MSDSILHDLYYDVKKPSSFTSVINLWKAAKEKDPSIKFEHVKQWLSKQITYTLHKPRRIKFKRNPTVVSCVDEQWQADLVDLSEFAKQNNGMKYLITIIDIMSKFARVFTTKSKTSAEVSAGFAKIFTEKKPTILQTDQGGEFDNKIMSAILKKHEIKYYTTRNTETKCAIVERFNRTLRGRMFKYFTSKGTRKYIDVLPDLVRAYNNTVHRSILMKPADVTPEDSKFLFKRLYGAKNERTLLLKTRVDQPKLSTGDNVRIQYMSGPLSKGYYPTWTDETFTVSKVAKDVEKPQYTLRDYQGEELEGRFYPEEVQQFTGVEYRVEKVIKSRKRNGVKQIFVKWVNFGDEHNSWINESDYVDVS